MTDTQQPEALSCAETLDLLAKCDDIAILQERIDAARHQRWLPIGTAPKTKDIVIATDGTKVYQSRRDVHANSSRNRYKSAGGAYIIATHWMPLPDPPSANDPA
ncbi:DUF551 domain-containing protein [Corticibacter populi]|nr:DUF551 domain-containing protein [Corticibacter populi]